MLANGALRVNVSVVLAVVTVSRLPVVETDVATVLTRSMMSPAARPARTDKNLVGASSFRVPPPEAKFTVSVATDPTPISRLAPVAISIAPVPVIDPVISRWPPLARMVPVLSTLVVMVPLPVSLPVLATCTPVALSVYAAIGEGAPVFDVKRGGA